MEIPTVFCRKKTCKNHNEETQEPSRYIKRGFYDTHKIYQSVVTYFNRTSTAVAIKHHQTSSKEKRTVDNPLFAVNYLDRLLRKDSSMYRRDTICFSRSTHNELLRNAFFLFSHNYCKPKRITTHARQTDDRHYSGVPIDEEIVRAYKQVMYTRRFLLSKAENIPPFFKAMWKKTVGTPLTGLNGLVPKFALE